MNVTPKENKYYEAWREFLPFPNIFINTPLKAPVMRCVESMKGIVKEGKIPVAEFQQLLELTKDIRVLKPYIETFGKKLGLL
jgi:hypothetical protein